MAFHTFCFPLPASAVTRAPACTTASAAAVAEPCTSTVPCLTEPHHRQHDPVRTSSARTMTEPWVTAVVAPAEPSLPPLAIATRPLPLLSHHCAHTASSVGRALGSASLALPQQFVHHRALFGYYIAFVSHSQ